MMLNLPNIPLNHFKIISHRTEKQCSDHWGGGHYTKSTPHRLTHKILNFNGRFEAYWQHFECFLGINRFRIDENLTCFNVWVVVGIVFAVRARKQRPPCF